jgi:hypothetical protein
VDAEIVLDQNDGLGVREVDVGQVFQDASIIHGGMAICDLDVAPAFERSKHHEERAERAEIRADRDELRERLMELCDAIRARQAAEAEVRELYRLREIERARKACATPASRCSEMPMTARERQLWTQFVRRREQRKNGKRAKKRRTRKAELSPAELEAGLDDLVREAQERLGARPGSATE